LQLIGRPVGKRTVNTEPLAGLTEPPADHEAEVPPYLLAVVEGAWETPGKA
jgi:hypothetical protein